MPKISLIGAPFVPTTSLNGDEPRGIYRGRNAIVRGLGGYPYIENYPGSRDLNEDYDLTGETLTGSLAWTSGSKTVTGTGTLFLTELRRGGRWIQSDIEVFVVNRVVSNTEFIADRAPTSTLSAKTGYLLPEFFEIDKQRGILRSGNAIVGDRKDITFVGDGPLFLNGVNTGFIASRRPKRLQRATNGTYTEFPIGYDAPPPVPPVTVTTDGVKQMIAGSYSFLFSWWNSVTDGFSNPTVAVKQTTAAADLTIALGGRFTVDVTELLANKPANADGIKIWGSLSGGGVSVVNASNFAEGAWFECKKLRFGSQNVTQTVAATDIITLPDHKYQDGEYIFLTNVGGLTGGHYVIKVDSNNFKVATTPPNFKAKTIAGLTDTVNTGTTSYFDANDIAFYEYLDSETGGLVTGDNDRPPECEYVTEFANENFYISALGKRKSDNPLGSSPGNYVLPAKAGNTEAAPVRWRVGVGDEIHGFANGAGRLFILTPNGVPFITPTGRSPIARLVGQAGTDEPFTSRPFWTKGGISPYNLTIVQGEVFGYSGRQPLRSPDQDRKTTPFELGRLIQALTKDVPDGHVLVREDPKNQQACFILSGVRKNASGYWESEIIPLDLQQNPSLWQPKILLTSTTRDMIVSGAAVVNNRLEFIAGGRVQGGPPKMKTYRYDERAGSGTVAWSVAFQPSDGGEESRAKLIRSFRTTGKLTAPVVQVHGANWDSPDINPNDIEDGTNSISGNITLPASTSLERSFRKKRLVKNLTLFTVRISSTWTDSGANDVDRLDELVIDVDTHGIGQ